MNRNEDRRLTPKQEELVKRLEQIRQSKNKKSQPTKQEPVVSQNKQRKGRNADVQQRGQKDRPKERPKESIFSQGNKNEQTIKRPRRDFTALRKKKEAAEKEKRRARQKKKKNSSKLTNQLAKGQSLAQAIALSEILDKPVSLRRNRR